MSSLINPDRPPVFCPGCSHNRSLQSLDRAFDRLALKANEVVIVTDIGCAGLLDTFFGTHAMHGLHGRALTYATGIKLACPHLKVVVIMGDGGVGIGGTHFIQACRRNLDLTLMVLNNFNFGMTGGQYSSTTPGTADMSSGFLNTIETPLDICSVAASAGAPFLVRTSAHQKNVPDLLAEAINFDGFALLDIWGLCPGQYGRRNRLSAEDIETNLNKLPPFRGPVKSNLRREYGAVYRESTTQQASGADPQEIEPIYEPSIDRRRKILLLGTAGGGVISAGSVLAHAAVSSGMHVTQKTEFNVTVMRGPSVTELIISPEPIMYTGVEKPDIIIALSQEGASKRMSIFEDMKTEGCVILAKGVKIPKSARNIRKVDFRAHGIKNKDRAIASLSILAEKQDPITYEMLENAVRQKFHEKRAREAIAILKKM